MTSDFEMTGKEHFKNSEEYQVYFYIDYEIRIEANVHDAMQQLLFSPHFKNMSPSKRTICFVYYSPCVSVSFYISVLIFMLVFFLLLSPSF